MSTKRKKEIMYGCERRTIRANDGYDACERWICVSRYDRRGRFVGGGEGDGEREQGERGDDDGDEDDECEEAYGVTSLESRNSKDDEKRYVNGSGNDGEKPAEYDDADNGDGGDGVGDGNGVFWDEGDGER